MSGFVILLTHLSYFFVSLKKWWQRLPENLQRTALQKSCSHEYRHRSDTVCHHIFDSSTCDSTRHAVNTPQIDKITPNHQTSGSSIVKAFDTERDTNGSFWKKKNDNTNRTGQCYGIVLSKSKWQARPRSAPPLVPSGNGSPSDHGRPPPVATVVVN